MALNLETPLTGQAGRQAAAPFLPEINLYVGPRDWMSRPEKKSLIPDRQVEALLSF